MIEQDIISSCDFLDYYPVASFTNRGCTELSVWINSYIHIEKGTGECISRLGANQSWDLAQYCQMKNVWTPHNERDQWRKRKNVLIKNWMNSLWPNDAIWQQRSGSTLARVMPCCLTAPTHYLNQCWFTISKIHQHSFTILQEILQPSITTISWKSIFLRFLWNLPGAKELMQKWKKPAAWTNGRMNKLTYKAISMSYSSILGEWQLLNVISHLVFLTLSII